MNELALFAGAGGGLLGSHLLGWRTVCAVEIDDYARSVLLARQNDGILGPFPVWDDVRTFDAKPWCGSVDVVSGGFPCQDISNSGHKAGIRGKQSGLWSEMARIIDEARPRYVFAENVEALLRRGFDVVLGDLAAMGFDARWAVLGTADIGGAQSRKRLWIVAHAKGFGRGAVQQEPGIFRAPGESGAGPASDRGIKYTANHKGVLRPTKPGLDRVADGMAGRVDRIRATGNGQDPRVAAAAFIHLAKINPN